MFTVTLEDNNFNPRSHEGSDSIIMDYPALQNISIHAPTRGATQWRCNIH